MKMFQEFWEDEEGITVVEILLVLAVLIIIAMLFRNTIIGWVQNMLATLFPDPGDVNSNVDPLQPT